MKPALQSILPVAAVIGIAMVMHFAGGMLLNGYQLNLAAQAGIAIVLAVSLNIVNGLAGQFSIGHAGFAAIGGYAAGALLFYGSIRIFGPEGIDGGILSYTLPLSFYREGMPLFALGDLVFPIAALLCGLLAAGIGWLVGLPSLRLRGDYLAIVTIGFAEIVRVLLESSRPQITQPEAVLAAKPTELMVSLGQAIGFNRVPKFASLFWVYLTVGAACLVAYRIKYSKFGRAYLAIREDEIAAEAMGVHTTRFKVQAFVISAFFAGLAGALVASSQGTITASSLAFLRSVEIVIMVVLGGLGSISGAVIAAVFLTLLPEVLQAEIVQRYRLILYAMVLILVMILRPRGLFGLREIWDFWKPGRKAEVL
jgi:branched-chain amino acid transport system permease protein